MHTYAQRCDGIDGKAEDVRIWEHAEMVLTATHRDVTYDEMDICAEIAYAEHHTFRVSGRA